MKTFSGHNLSGKECSRGATNGEERHLQKKEEKEKLEKEKLADELELAEEEESAAEKAFRALPFHTCMLFVHGYQVLLRLVAHSLHFIRPSRRSRDRLLTFPFLFHSST